MKRIKSLSGMLAALAIAALGTALVAWSGAAGDGVRLGMDICARILIPALFPFMALSCYLARSGAARILSAPLCPVTTKVLRLQGELGAVVLLSAIGGYPVGAKMIASYLEQGRIDGPTAKRMLCFCFGGSPSFIIAAVGTGMFGSRRMGVLLFAAHVIATLAVGALFSLKAPTVKRESGKPPQKGGAAAFVAAVGDASGAMIAMCAFAVLFSALAALIAESGIIGRIAGILTINKGMAEACLAGLLEVTGGCLAASRLGGDAAIILTSAICSFGGLSIIFQVASYFKAEMSLGPFLLGRLLHGTLSAAISLPLCRALGGVVTETMAAGVRPVPQAVGRPWPAAICLLAMCSMVVMGQKQEKVDRRGK